MSNLFSVPNLFFYLGLLPDFHLVILFTLCLCINFSCHSRKTLKGFLKSLLALKKKKQTKKTYHFYSSGIKEMVGNSWACVPQCSEKV